MKYLIIGADRIIDGRGDLAETEAILELAHDRGLRVSVLKIVSLAQRWEDNLPPNHFKSGASAMAAINKARKIMEAGKSDVVVIKGSDQLRTGLSKEEREKYMKLYGQKYTPLDGYTKLVRPFIRYHGITERQFFEIRDSLFENYSRTWTQLHPDKKLPDDRWFQPVTKYFRGVDCANPNIDYQAQLVLTDDRCADILKVPKKNRVSILGNAFTSLSVDGFESIPEVAPYLHLKRVIKKALTEAQINFKNEFLTGTALLEAYTCYPVVPMGLLLRLGLVDHMSEIPAFLEDHEITITGGLNLARAPWNLTSLNYLIAMREKLLSSKNCRYGLVHGNGSLGNQQGVTVLGKV